VVHAVAQRGKWIDPDHQVGAMVVDVNVLTDVVVALSGRLQQPARFSDDWERADIAAGATIAEVLAAEPGLTEPAIARAAVRCVPARGALVVSSSMPVRDVEWFAEPRADVTVVANRGANGIDGVIATAIGVAATGRATVCLIGDVAFLHDSSSLIALARRTINLTIIVTDNDGGGIFSFLPQATSLAHDRYEQLFGTPHGTDLALLCAAHGIAATVVSSAADISFSPGVRVLIAKTERQPNVGVHDRINTAVSAALDTLGS
jgi:2-succinyl-5-enolpyruvyl-6-hydroxy-3-cyclohexene-1-carboxylate synthase